MLMKWPRRKVRTTSVTSFREPGVTGERVGVIPRMASRWCCLRAVLPALVGGFSPAGRAALGARVHLRWEGPWRVQLPPSPERDPQTKEGMLLSCTRDRAGWNPGRLPVTCPRGGGCWVGKRAGCGCWVGKLLLTLQGKGAQAANPCI